MTILFAGGELGSFTPSDNTVIETEDDTFGGWESPFARCGITVPGPFALSAPFASTNSIWVHFNVGQLLAFGPVPFLQVFSGATPIFQMTVDHTGLYKMFYWTGSAFAQVGSGFFLPLANTQTFDVELSAGAIFCYVSGTTKDGATGTFTDVTTMTAVEFMPTGDYMIFSECIVADQPTLGYRLQVLPITGNGSSSGFVGDFTDVNEIVTNDGQFISTPTAAEVSLFEQATVTTENVLAVVVTARANTVSGAPQNMQLAIKSGSTTAFSSTIAQGTAFQPNVGIFATDPATSAAWTNAAVNAMQYGVKSIA